MSETKKPSVYTKGAMYQILENFSNNIRGMKTVKEVREYIDVNLPTFKPSGRGRRSSTPLDMAKLQTLVDEQAEKVAGNDGRYLLGMAASAWNVQAESGATLLDANRLRTLVEKQKLTLPEKFSLPARQKRPRKLAV